MSSSQMYAFMRLLTRNRPTKPTFGFKHLLPCMNCQFSNHGNSTDHVMVQRHKSYSSKPSNETIEALKRWEKDNTRLFGPILKNSPIIPLGKKKRKRKSEPKLPKQPQKTFDGSHSVNTGHTGTGQNLDVVDILSAQSTMDEKGNTSVCSDSTPGSSAEFSEDSNEQILNRIFNFKVTSLEDVTSINPLRSRLQQYCLPARPTVSGILARTRSPESQFFLDRWKTQMISELGEEGFRQYQSDMLRRGINLHACIQQYLEGTALSDLQLQDDNKGHWTSIEKIISQVNSVQALESRVVHPDLQYAGTYDCTAVYKDTMCLIDWKTSTKPKPLLSNTFDYPLQVAAYIGALNADPSQEVKVRNGLVVVAYGGGEPAHAHLMTSDQCEYYWKQWLQRLHQYWTSVLCPTPV